MHLARLYFTTMLLAAAIALPIASTGCAEHRYARVYDPYYSDYHRWGPDEVRYYNRWEVETHREHRDWNRRTPDEQKEYWSWRHSNHDHDKH